MDVRNVEASVAGEQQPTGYQAEQRQPNDGDSGYPLQPCGAAVCRQFASLRVDARLALLAPSGRNCGC
jgi:hypothetical protein